MGAELFRTENVHDRERLIDDWMPRYVEFPASVVPQVVSRLGQSSPYGAPYPIDYVSLARVDND